MKTLHLNLKAKWFYMILAGIKQEEYRELKVSMISLMFNWSGSKLTREEFLYFVEASAEWVWNYKKNFDTITFSNGYAKDRAQMVVDCTEFKVDYGREEWGAKDGIEYLVLSTGKVLSMKNINEDLMVSR